ncbi:MAG: transposase [Moheibacter sp.]
MSKYRKLTYVYYKCDYHIVFTPKYRFRILEGTVKSLVEYDLQVISTWEDIIIQEMNI